MRAGLQQRVLGFGVGFRAELAPKSGPGGLLSWQRGTWVRRRLISVQPGLSSPDLGLPGWRFCPRQAGLGQVLG